MRADTNEPSAAAAASAEAVAAVRVLARLSRVLERSAGGLSLAQYRVLSAIADGDDRASRIAASLALGKPTISATVDGLCQRGLLRRGGHATDQRVAALALTEAGAERLAATEAAMTSRLGDVCGPAGGALYPALIALGPALDATRASSARGAR